MVPLYILGLLQRFGSQHGYQIKKIISEQLADFTQIKLPTIYYHLEKMQKDGLLLANSEKSDMRPEKVVYSITDKGIAEFKAMLNKQLAFDYRPTFELDSVFYFSSYIDPTDIAVNLKKYIEKLTNIISLLATHKKETLEYVPDDMKSMVYIIFSHHERHYKAELEWAEETFDNITGDDDNGKTASN